MNTSVWFGAAAAFVLVLPTVAAAQSMTPMRGEVSSFTDEFAVRVRPYNPYRQRILVEVKVYDENFRPVKARITPATIMLGSDNSRPVLVVLPFEGAGSRRVRICTESVPFPNQPTRIKAQICGRFLGRRLH